MSLYVTIFGVWIWFCSGQIDVGPSPKRPKIVTASYMVKESDIKSEMKPPFGPFLNYGQLS